jgi:hypothetical protein
MERNLIITEYLKLRKSLNQGNKLANETTTFGFKIEALNQSEYRLIALTTGTADVCKIEICRRDIKGYWERSGFSGHKNFELFCANFLNEQEYFRKKNSHSKKENIKLILIESAQKLQKVFDELLVNHPA